MSLEAWLEFQRNERYTQDTPVCNHCGGDCSGDVTQDVELVDGITADVAICDEPDDCPANKE